MDEEIKTVQNPNHFNGLEFSKNLTQQPGVYQMFNQQGKLLYIGKAKHLKNRVSSYFNKYLEVPRTREMISQVRQIKITITHSESEALLLEAQLIKEFQPQYNILLRTGKQTVYVGLGLSQAFPRIFYVHGQPPPKSKDQYFGPFNTSFNAKKTIELLQKIFKLRTCSDPDFKSRSRPCLQHQINLCTAPCVQLISQEEYLQNSLMASQFLKGKNKEISNELTIQMQKASQDLNFEKAAWLRDRIEMLKQLRQGQYVQGVDEDMDVFACSDSEELLCVTILPFRKGINLGSQSYYIEKGLADIQDQSNQDLQNGLSQFILQHYLTHEIPEKILINFVFNSLDELNILNETINQLAPHKVSINPNKQVTYWQKFKDMAQKNADEALKLKIHEKKYKKSKWQALEEFLNFSKNTLNRVEAYDISHHRGEGTVGSCVCFLSGNASKENYRGFPIVPTVAGDDYEAMGLLIKKRFAESTREALPEVLLIDGGEGQVKAVNYQLEILNHTVFKETPFNPVIIGVRKGVERIAGEEILIMPNGEEVKLGKNSQALQMIQNIRDEAHRFAITKQRKKLRRKRVTSQMLSINGVGKKTTQALLSHIGGIKQIEDLTLDDLEALSFLNKKQALSIYNFFHH